MGILQKLSAGDDSVFKEGETDLMEGGMAALLPVAQSFIDPIVEDIKKELGDENIAVIKNVDGELIITLLKGSETTLEIESEETIIKTFNISQMADLIKNMSGDTENGTK